METSGFLVFPQVVGHVTGHFVKERKKDYRESPPQAQKFDFGFLKTSKSSEGSTTILENSQPEIPISQPEIFREKNRKKNTASNSVGKIKHLSKIPIGNFEEFLFI